MLYPRIFGWRCREGQGASRYWRMSDQPSQLLASEYPQHRFDVVKDTSLYFNVYILILKLIHISSHIHTIHTIHTIYTIYTIYHSQKYVNERCGTECSEAQRNQGLQVPPSSSKSSKVHGPSFHRYAAFLGFQVSHRMLSSLLKSRSSLDLCDPTQSSFILLSFYSVSNPVSNSIRINTISIPFYALPCYSILFSFYSILMYRSIGVRGLSIYIYIISIYMCIPTRPIYSSIYAPTYWCDIGLGTTGCADCRITGHVRCRIMWIVDCRKKPEFDDHLQMLRGFCQSEFCIVLYHHGCRTCSSSLSCRPSLCLTFAICRG